MYHITSYYENLDARYAKIPYVENDLSIIDGYIVFMLTLYHMIWHPSGHKWASGVHMFLLYSSCINMTHRWS